MELVKRIKGFFYGLSLNRAVKNVANVKREMVNISDAKNVGILFNASKPNEVVTVTQFADQLRETNREVYLLGFQNKKDKEDPGPRFFNKESVNFFEVPSDTKIDGFQKNNLDILICAFKEECLPLEYIAATSKAKFRVGAFSQSKTNFYELMINTGSNQELKYLLQQVFHFLKVINKK